MSELSTLSSPFLNPFGELISVPGQFDLPLGPCFIEINLFLLIQVTLTSSEIF